METTTIVLDGATFTFPVEVLAHFEKQVSEVKTAQSKMVADHAAALGLATAERDALQAKVDAAEAAIITEDKLDEMVAERVALLDCARKVVADYDGAKKTGEEICKDVCTRKGVEVKDRSPEYIKARFDILVEDAGKEATKRALVGDAKPQSKTGWQAKRNERITGKKETSK